MAQSGFLKCKRLQMAIQSHLRANQVEQITGIEKVRAIFLTLHNLHKHASYRYFLIRYEKAIFHLFRSFLYL